MKTKTLALDNKEHLNVLTIAGYKYYEVPAYICVRCGKQGKTQVHREGDKFVGVFIEKSCLCKPYATQKKRIKKL